MKIDNHVTKYIGRKLREKRLEKNFSQQAVADALKMSKSMISNIENGVYNIKINKLTEIAAYYDLEVHDITPPEKMYDCSLPENSVRRVRILCR